MRKTFILIAVAALALLILAPAWGQVPMVPQAPPPAPNWRAVPSAPGIEYAPNLNQDVFRHQGKYYYYDGSKWHSGKNYLGPWLNILQPPQVFYQVEPHYFKRPPGWDRGRKAGWQCDMPPGQAKKVYQTGPPGHSKKGKSLPPGQMKKMGY